MKAMLLHGICDLSENDSPLRYEEVEKPEPGETELLIEVSVCGVCHTELDEIEGRTAPPEFPVILGHQVVGKIDEIGNAVTRYKVDDRVGVAWIFSACGLCRYCLEGNENLCEKFRATGRDANGGYAQYMTVQQDYAYKIPDSLGDEEAAPLLCAGAIGYRSLKLTQIGDGQHLGLTGFGSSGHLVIKMAKYLYPNGHIYVFARSKSERDFAMELGATWSGDTGDIAPVKLDAIIDTTPAWKPVVKAMLNLKSGGRLVINAIRKGDFDKDYLKHLEYSKHLWLEKEIKTVANIQSNDVREFLQLAGEVPIKPDVKTYPLKKANQALLDMKNKDIRGAKVLRIGRS